MTHRTVKSLAEAAGPEDLFRGQWQYNRTSALDEYKPYLDERWDEGCTNAWKLWEEIIPLDYTGSYGIVSAYIRKKRTSPRPVTARPPAPREVTRWILSRPESLTEIDQLRLKAVLATTNSLVGRISEKISVENVTARGELPPVEHDLHWDPELAAAAGFVVASLLEWPALPRQEALTKTLRTVADFYRTKFTRGTAGARTKIRTIERAVTALAESKPVRARTAQVLHRAYDAGLMLVGQPVADWQEARARLRDSTELDELSKQVRMLRLLNATDTLAITLTQAWDRSAAYTDAATAVRRALASDQLTVPEQNTAAVSLMSMHRSKGKEFDGVVIAEGAHHSRLLDAAWDEERTRANRRLLRVAITRARYMVIFVRPEDAVPLTPQ
jgi:DNA helicase-2/ATP-dependent DNA helicase PcrA